MHPLPVAVELDAFERVLLRLLPRLVAFAVHQLMLERLEEGFRGCVVSWAARPRHGLGDSMGLKTALERPGSVLGTLVIAEDEAEVVGRALPSDRLLERIRDRLLGHAPGHRPAHGLPVGRVDHGCEAGPSFARLDVADPPLLWRPQGAGRLQRPEDDASRDREGVEQGAQRRPEADRRDRQLQQARLVEVQGGP